MIASTMRITWLCVCSVFMVACGGDDDPAVDAGGEADAPAAVYDAAPASDGAPTNDAAPGFDGAPPDATPAFDCATIPATPLSTQAIAGARGYHGLAITAEGDMVGSDGSSLIKSDYDGNWSVFLPGFGDGEQVDVLPNGDLVMAADDGSLARITPQGARSLLAADVWAYGVVLGPDGLIYTAGGGAVVKRVDSSTGQTTTLIPNVGQTTRPVGFSPDNRRMYIATIGDGTVYYQDFDVNMNLDGPVTVFASNVGDGWHDAVAVDACGYVYVPDFWTSGLYRIHPDGTPQLYWQPQSSSGYAHGLTWGTGEHGWREDALYAPQPYNNNTVIEIVTGVPPRDWAGTVINAPAGLP
jgi:hypothetical protein